LFDAFIHQNQWRNVQLLVERGADVNANVSVGRTILSVYASRGAFQMVHWLMEHGADPTLDYVRNEPTTNSDSHAIEAIFWHPGTPEDPTSQRESQRWLLSRGYGRPPM